MRRGTTPTFQFDVDADLSMWDVYASFGQYDKAIVTWKPTNVETTEDGCTVTVKLTQQETLAFDAGIPAQAQLRAYKDGSAVATGIWEFDVTPIILEGEIPMDVSQEGEDEHD